MLIINYQLFLGEWPGYPLNFLRRTPAQKDTVTIPIANSITQKIAANKKAPQPEILVTKINYQLSIINYQLSIIQHGPQFIFEFRQPLLRHR